MYATTGIYCHDLSAPSCTIIYIKTKVLCNMLIIHIKSIHSSLLEPPFRLDGYKYNVIKSMTNFLS